VSSRSPYRFSCATSSHDHEAAVACSRSSDSLHRSPSRRAMPWLGQRLGECGDHLSLVQQWITSRGGNPRAATIHHRRLCRAKAARCRLLCILLKRARKRRRCVMLNSIRGLSMHDRDDYQDARLAEIARRVDAVSCQARRDSGARRCAAAARAHAHTRPAPAGVNVTTDPTAQRINRPSWSARDRCDGDGKYTRRSIAARLTLAPRKSLQ
jgi:hypothetical protein